MPIMSSTAVDRRSPSRMGQRPTVVVPILVLANLAVFAAEMAAGPGLESFLLRWGLVPAEVSGYVRGAPGIPPAVLVTLLTSLFLHVGWVHLLVNMLYLLVFGGSTERALGSARFLLLYLGGGLVGAVAQVLAVPDSVAPVVGASGAIAATMGAQLVLYPGATLGSIAPVLFFSSVHDLSAAVLLVVWVGAQVLIPLLGLGEAPSAIAWWSHLGGFVGGALLAVLLRPRRRWW